MKVQDFTFGRQIFCTESFEMVPCLPDTVERRIQFYYADADGLMESHFIDFDQLKEEAKDKTLLWLHISGSIGDEFWKCLKDFLDLSDEQVKILRFPHKRAFFEDYPNGMLWTIQRPSVTENVDALETVNFYMSDKVLFTRQFSHDNAFSIASHNLISQGEMHANMTADVLSGELMEDVLLGYVDVLKLGGTKLETIQNKIIRNPGKKELHLINRSQQMIWIFLNVLWPVETVINSIHKSKNRVLTEAGKQEYSYRMDEVGALVRTFETYRSMSYNLMDVYVSGLGLRTNETTEVLTIVATLFLPPTLIAGIYGMNFQIPEVHNPYGYYICLISMFVVSGGLLYLFAKRGLIRF